MGIIPMDFIKIAVAVCSEPSSKERVAEQRFGIQDSRQVFERNYSRQAHNSA